jgi:hypothetical protein
MPPWKERARQPANDPPGWALRYVLRAGYTQG